MQETLIQHSTSQCTKAEGPSNRIGVKGNAALLGPRWLIHEIFYKQFEKRVVTYCQSSSWKQML